MSIQNKNGFSQSLNKNQQYLNFIKGNQKMIENHLITQFQHPYKRSLLESYGIIPKQKDNHQISNKPPIDNKNQPDMIQKQKQTKNNRYDDRIQSMRTIQYKADRKQINLNSNNSVNLSPVKESSKMKSRKQQICNSLNFVNPSSSQSIGKSLQVSLLSQLSKQSQNHNILHRHQDILSHNMITRQDILHIVQQKNRQISQQLLKQRNNFSQIMYKNNHHQHNNHNQLGKNMKSISASNNKNGDNYVLERYENSRTVMKIKQDEKQKQRDSRFQINSKEQAYRDDDKNKQILSQPLLGTIDQTVGSSNLLLLPSISKKRSLSYRDEPITTATPSQHYHNQLQLQSITHNNNNKANQKRPPHNNKKLTESESTTLKKSINQLRQQFQHNSDSIKMYKKVEKNNIALKVRQINEKNLKSYYDYENSIVKNAKNSHLKKQLINKQQNILTITNQTRTILPEKGEKKYKVMFNDKLIEFSLNDALNEENQQNIGQCQLSQEQIFIREILGNKSEEEVRKSLGGALLDVMKSKIVQHQTESKLNSRQVDQTLGQSQNLNFNENNSTSLSPLKRYRTTHLKNQQSLTLLKQNNSSLYEIKVNSYRQFAFKILFTYKKFSSLIIKQLPSTTMKNEQKYRFYVGKGNNSLLIKSLMKRRFWWVLEDDPKKAHFVWTQLKINSLFNLQKKAEIKSLYYKSQKNHEQKISTSVKKQHQSNKKKEQKNQQKEKKSSIFKPPFPQDNEMKIFTLYDKEMINKLSNAINESNNSQKWQNFSKRKQYFPQNYFQPQFEGQQIGQKTQKTEQKQQQEGQNNVEILKSYRVHNHFEFNHFMGNKKALFYNLRYYYNLIGKDVYDIIPLTFHIRNGQKDPQYNKFLKYYKTIQKRSNKNANQQSSSKKKQKNIWIVKPGQNSNRGQGIQVFDEVYELNNILKQKNAKNPNQQHTYIVQKYIERPLLYRNRKFDIRHYFVLTRMWGKMKAYFFGQGYIRTASYEFDLNNVGDTEIHLTNDAIQKYTDSYGKYQQGNKLSYVEFQRYLDQLHKEQCPQGNSVKKNKNSQKKPVSFANDIYPQMRNIATQAVKACYIQMDPNKTEHNFEVFGMDFMIDRDYKVWLIEINTNPCLQLSSKLLQRVIPSMVQQSLRLTIDVLFPQPYHYPNTMKHMMPDYSLQKLKFELIFDEDRDGKQLQEMFNKNIEKQKSEGKKTIRQMLLGEVDEQDETYENDGNQIVIGGQKQGVQL